MHPNKEKKLKIVPIWTLFLMMSFTTCFCQSQRQQRLFPLLSWVIFPNSPCLADNSTTGTCLSSSTCKMLKGNTTGSTCASGYGVCCIFLYSCGSTLTQNNSYFQNPGYPTSSTRDETCIVTVEKVKPNIAQIRLNFEEFDINGVTNQVCEQDAFQVFGQDSNFIVPSICGMNSQQHMYINLGSVRGPVILAMTTTGNGNRRWRIRVTQIERTNPSLAPNGCLQYHEGPNGNVMSFNFNSAVTVDQSNIQRNLNYAICIRREAGYCGIQYTSAPGSFNLRGPTVISADSQCESVDNAADLLYIPFNRYCGGNENSPEMTFSSNLAGLFHLIFKSGDNSSPGTYRGFNLDYQQILCNSITLR